MITRTMCLKCLAQSGSYFCPTFIEFFLLLLPPKAFTFSLPGRTDCCSLCCPKVLGMAIRWCYSQQSLCVVSTPPLFLPDRHGFVLASTLFSLLNSAHYMLNEGTYFTLYPLHCFIFIHRFYHFLNLYHLFINVPVSFTDNVNTKITGIFVSFIHCVNKIQNNAWNIVNNQYFLNA